MKKGDTYKKVRARYLAAMKRYNKLAGKTIYTVTGPEVAPPSSRFDAMVDTSAKKVTQMAQMNRALNEMHQLQHLNRSSAPILKKELRVNAWNNFVKEVLAKCMDKIREQAKLSDLRAVRMSAYDWVATLLESMSENARARGGLVLENDSKTEAHLSSLIENSILPSDDETRASFYRALTQAVNIFERISPRVAHALRDLIKAISASEDWREEEL